MKADVVDFLRRYISRRNIYLTQRGNKSILLALKVAKQLGYEKVIIQDQGGWITYSQYIERLKLELVKVKTDFGVIDPDVLSKNLDSKTCVLLNSMSGYAFIQPTALINSICKQKNSFLINDSSGSIGLEDARYGDIIIGSFGDKKPINLEYGGFIAFDNLDFDKTILEDAVFEREKIPSLMEKLKLLPERLSMFAKVNKKIKDDLKDFQIIHPTLDGINVIIKFKDLHERETIINYCEKNNYEWTECPRNIRVNCDAICIEVKRLK